MTQYQDHKLNLSRKNHDSILVQIEKPYLITEYHSALIKYCIVKILFPVQRRFERKITT